MVCFPVLLLKTKMLLSTCVTMVCVLFIYARRRFVTHLSQIFDGEIYTEQKVKTLYLNCLPSIYKIMQTKNAIESASKCSNTV